MSDRATLHPEMTRNEYTDLPGINWSILKYCIDHPSKAMHAMLNPSKPSARMIMGSAIHSGFLEGWETLNRNYIATPEGIDRRTKTGKEQYAAFEAKSRGKQVVTPDAWKTVMNVVERLNNHPTVNTLINGKGQSEAVITFELCEGLEGKGILDWMPTDHGPIVDLKTTRDASPKGFARQIANYQYHGQGCYYRRALAQLNGEPARDFVIVAVETEPPYCVGIYKLNPEAIDAGERMVDMCIDRWLAAAQQTGFDPYYTDHIEPLGVPVWAMNDETTNVVA